MTANGNQRRTARAWRSWRPALAAALWMLTVVPGPPPAAAADSDADAEAGEAACEWTCLRWGRKCSIDPRGVRRCRRACENFGEVCPPADAETAPETVPGDPGAAPSP